MRGKLLASRPLLHLVGGLADSAQTPVLGLKWSDFLKPLLHPQSRDQRAPGLHLPRELGFFSPTKLPWSFGLQTQPLRRSRAPQLRWEHFPQQYCGVRLELGMSRMQAPERPSVSLPQMLPAFLSKRGFCFVPGSQGGLLASTPQPLRGPCSS